MENRNGDLVSAQISVAGNVDFSGGNFRMDTPFCLKNDGEAAIVKRDGTPKLSER